MKINLRMILMIILVIENIYTFARNSRVIRSSEMSPVFRIRPKIRRRISVCEK